MYISQLIGQLDTIRQAYGNIEVVMADDSNAQVTNLNAIEEAFFDESDGYAVLWPEGAM